MNQLRWRLITFITWLTLFFNIERLDLDINGFENINLPSAVYIVGIAASLAALTSVVQRRSVWVLMVLSILAYLGSLVLLREPIFGGVHAYLTFTGIFALVVTVYLAYAVGQSLNEFLHAVEEITFSNKGGRLRAESEAQDLVHLEMISSRRSQRPMSLVVLQADASSMNMMMHRLVQDIQRSMMQRYLMGTIARVMSRSLRRTDVIIESPHPGRLIFLAPETSAEAATSMGERLTQMAQERLGLDANYSVATFPQQALTYEELVNVAEQRLREQAPIMPGLLEPEEQFSRIAEQRAQEPLPKANVAPKEAQA